MPEEPISRRVLLLGGATALLVSGCDDEPAAAPTTPTGSEPGPPGSTAEVTGDDALVKRAIAGARDLAAAYAALAARHPDTRPTTAPLRAHVNEHLTALGQEPAAEGPGRSLRSRKQAVLAVLAAERTASAARLDDAVAASSGDLARVLASIGASHAQHALVLERLGG